MPRFSGLRLFEIGGYALQVFLVEAVPRLGVPGRVSGGDRPGTTMFVPNYGPQRKS
jgi:hypothetical protein